MSKQPSPRDELADAAAYERLRELLVGATNEQLEQLQRQVDEQRTDVEQVSQLLPDAIRVSAARDQDFARALGPTLSEAFEASIKRDPQGLADTIAPIMGPAIRSAIAHAIRGMVQSLNKTLDHSFSPRGIRWRTEAWRTGKPFAEVVLLHTLVYRTEQVLLIHRETGLLLQSVSAEPHDDADLVSAMLTAIQDFVRDSFKHTSESSGALETMSSDDLTIWIQHGPRALLAAAVRGEPPITLREKLQEQLELVHVKHGDALAKFDGDASRLELVRPLLEECLQTQFVHERTDAEGARRPKWQRRLAWIVPVLIVLGGISWGLSGWRRHRQLQRISVVLEPPPGAEIRWHDDAVTITGKARAEWIQRAENRLEWLPGIRRLDYSGLEITDAPWVDYLAALRAEPGIVVTSTRRIGDDYELQGLRDPLAADPRQLLAKTGLSPQRVHETWEAYHCLDDAFVLQRLSRRLPPPAGVHWTMAGGTLTVVGKASQGWVRDLQTTVQELEKPTTLDASGLSVSHDGWLNYIQRLRNEPGIEVVSQEVAQGRFIVRGRRDKLAADPRDLLDSAQMDPNLVSGHWEAFLSDDPEIILRRARQRLNPPETIQVAFQSGVLQLTGEAEHQWLSRLEQVDDIPGVTRIDARFVEDVDWRKLTALTDRLEQLSLDFESSASTWRPDQAPRVEQAAALARDLLAAASAVAKTIEIQIISLPTVADRGPDGRIDDSLSSARADRVVRALTQQGVPRQALRAVFPRGQDERAERSEVDALGQIRFRVR